ncbi:hypothetical protein ABT174_33715 [Streptomyces sparsogenes]|uniref:hypothetical protein n=1 Tax=Streptomyces sparsogenes TaxID=67365 RepID=UPI00332692CC
MAEDPQLAAVQSAAEQLALLGGTRPRVIPEPGATRIEIEVTGRLADHWPQVLDVLTRAPTSA